MGASGWHTSEISQKHCIAVAWALPKVGMHVLSITSQNLYHCSLHATPRCDVRLCAGDSSSCVPARFLLAESEDALWVAFMGTKNARDLLTNGHILMGHVWPELSPDEPGRAAAAHKGYLSRARGIPVEQLYAEARRRGKRLVLCGASQWNFNYPYLHKNPRN